MTSEPNGTAAQAVADNRWMGRWQWSALLCGGVFALLALMGFVLSPVQFFRSYLMAYLFWLSLGVGSLGVMLLHNIVGGNWGMAIRRLIEAGSKTLPLMLVLFVPVLQGMGVLYEWAQPDKLKVDELLRFKQPFLNPAFFTVRVVIYFVYWIAMTWLVIAWSRENVFPFRIARLKGLSGPAIILFVFTVSFAAIDWQMSLEPHWYSTIYPAIQLVGDVLLTLSFCVLGLILVRPHEPRPGFLTTQHFHDLGNLMLAFTMLWAYLSASQLIIIYSANLPEETPWYLHRIGGGWGVIAGLLIVGHFIIPFLLLLMRYVKRRAELLAGVAIFLIVMRLVDIYWTVEPAFQSRLSPHWMDLVTLLAIGGFWLGAFFWIYSRGPVFPTRILQSEGGN